MAASSPPHGEEDEEMPEIESISPPTRHSEEINWEVVAKMAGLIPAQIVADRLISEGIPARAWQEGAGQAIGLTVGLLGTGYVVVPEENVDDARRILAETENIVLDFDEDDSGDY